MISIIGNSEGGSVEPYSADIITTCTKAPLLSQNLLGECAWTGRQGVADLSGVYNSLSINMVEGLC